jgi:hypothetical protein
MSNRVDKGTSSCPLLKNFCSILSSCVMSHFSHVYQSITHLKRSVLISWLTNTQRTIHHNLKLSVLIIAVQVWCQTHFREPIKSNSKLIKSNNSLHETGPDSLKLHSRIPSTKIPPQHQQPSSVSNYCTSNTLFLPQIFKLQLVKFLQNYVTKTCLASYFQLKGTNWPILPNVDESLNTEFTTTTGCCWTDN